MRRNSKNIKNSLKHLNDIHPIFLANAKKCLPDSDAHAINEYVNLLLNNYLQSDKIITDNQIKEFNEK